jgi:putative Ca2+/H+ antiporter (TMEM165/GDT1 family)
MESLLSAAAFAALAELGDKSQFALLVLSFRAQHARTALVLALSAAIVLAHVPAAIGGAYFAESLDPTGVRLTMAILLFGMAGFALLADYSRPLFIVRIGSGVFLTSLVTVLVAELGDKSQIAEAVMSVERGSMTPLIGGIIGCIAINLPIAIGGPWLAEKLVATGVHFRALSAFTALVFAARGVRALVDL